MAPIDRREHRQQRVRGAGNSSVQASFGFNFGALGATTVKQVSLPPQPFSRRTPVRGTPQSVNKSAQRHRSASVQRSAGSRNKGTPDGHIVTPRLGKRKRGSPNEHLELDDGELDELSPDREGSLGSIEKSRRTIGAVLPIREDLDAEPDELSVLEESAHSALKIPADVSTRVIDDTRSPILARKVDSLGDSGLKTPSTGSNGTFAQRSVPHAQASTTMEAATPRAPPIKRPRLPTVSENGPDSGTQAVRYVEDESEDELSPPKTNEPPPRVVSKSSTPHPDAQEDVYMDEDELSSMIQPSPAPKRSPAIPQAAKQKEIRKTSGAQQFTSGSTKRGQPTQAVGHGKPEVHTVSSPEAVQRHRVSKNKRGGASDARKLREHNMRKANAEAEGDSNTEELSPEVNQDKDHLERVIEISDGDNESETREHGEDQQVARSRQVSTVQRSKDVSMAAVRSSPKKQLGKRVKLSGVKQAISVMRIKGSTVRGITVADTARTILEENIDHRLTRMMEKVQTSQDPVKRKELRGEMNLTLSFKESLDEKLLDLQDANDVLSTNFKKMKMFRRDNAALRKEILALQSSRQEVAVEHDDVQTLYLTEKSEAEARNRVSSDMFAIEAAIRNGRRKARNEGREDEGPNVPLTMLLDNVSRNVGSRGGGLLSNIKVFNSALEKAAGWLEGRA